MSEPKTLIIPRKNKPPKTIKAKHIVITPQPKRYIKLSPEQIEELSPLRQFKYYYRIRCIKNDLSEPTDEAISKSQKYRIIQFEETNEIDVCIIIHNTREYLYCPAKSIYVGERRQRIGDDGEKIYIPAADNEEVVIYDYEIWNECDYILPISAGIYSPFNTDYNGRPIPTYQVVEKLI
jgi:nitrogen fixation protein